MESKGHPSNRTKKTTRKNMDPSEFKLIDDPKGLKLPLMQHQKKNLTLLVWRETQEPSGGLLADDMGLGKTLTMISLVLKSKESNIDNNNNNTEIVNVAKPTVSKRPQRKTAYNPFTSGTPTTQYPGGTLIICPAGLIKQWSDEIKNKTEDGFLSTMIHHGQNRKDDPKQLVQYDVVITTYDIVRNEHRRCGAVFGVQWRRVIVDEAHMIRNHTLRTSLAVCGIVAKSRWALTGTPVNNTSDDMYAILKFLRYTPLPSLKDFRECTSEGSNSVKAALSKLLPGLVFRKTKAELIEKGDFQNMPMKTFKSIPIDLDPEEMSVYKEYEENSKTHLKKYLNQEVDESDGCTSHKSNKKKDGRGAAFTHLLRLRQICCHPGLTKQNNVPIEDMNLSPNNKPKTKKATSEKIKKSSVFDFCYASTKIKILIKMLKKDVPREDKVIVVSQFKSFLKVVAFHLDDAGINHTTLDGSVPISKRSTIVDTFNEPTTNPKVLLLSLKAGGTGLNLVGANHLFMLDLHWNPQMENQAQDRIYRIGQNKPVFVYKFITRGTIEERIQALQQHKLKIADDVIKLSKLNLQELQMLLICK